MNWVLSLIHAWLSKDYKSLDVYYVNCLINKNKFVVKICSFLSVHFLKNDNSIVKYNVLFAIFCDANYFININYVFNIRVLYHIPIYLLYRYFDYMIPIILVTKYFKQYIFA